MSELTREQRIARIVGTLRPTDPESWPVNIVYVAAEFDRYDAALRATIGQQAQEIARLNTVLRAAGWGQGEIDSAAYTFDQLTTANSKLVQERDEARQQLAALTLTWTTETPTVAGWYWFRRDRHDPDPAPVQCTNVDNIDPYYEGGQWAGQIPMPRDRIIQDAGTRAQRLLTQLEAHRKEGA